MNEQFYRQMNTLVDAYMQWHALLGDKGPDSWTVNGPAPDAVSLFKIKVFDAFCELYGLLPDVQ